MHGTQTPAWCKAQHAAIVSRFCVKNPGAQELMNFSDYSNVYHTAHNMSKEAKGRCVK